MLVTNKNTIRFGLQKRTIGQRLRLGPTSVRFVLIAILAIVALFYLTQSTQSATKNYKIRELEDKKNQLEQEQERLGVEVIRLKSLNEIKNSTQNLNMEEVKQLNYLEDPNKPVATERK